MPHKTTPPASRRFRLPMMDWLFSHRSFSGTPFSGGVFPGLLFSALLLSGCSVIGGITGHARDDQESLTKIIPIAEAGTLRKGATVYLTIPNRETLKGRFTALTEQDGRKYVNLKTRDGETKVGLGDVTEIAEDIRDNDKLVKGILIGGAVDVVVIGGGLLLYYEIQKHTTTIE